MYIKHSYNFISFMVYLSPWSFYYNLPTIVFVHSFNMCKPPLCMYLCIQFLMLTNHQHSLNPIAQLFTLQCHITHPLYNHLISLQLCEVLFFYCPVLPKSFTATSNSSHNERFFDSTLQNNGFALQFQMPFMRFLHCSI